ncbi:MAG: J domain-containing protein, partial [Halobacteriales archaeon]|nr:J domain-containing protein [Halobacteriales archaeon]
SARHDRCPECGHQPPHEVLNVAPDAPEAVVKAAARERLKATHPDRGGSRGEFQRVKRARDRLLDQ